MKRFKFEVTSGEGFVETRRSASRRETAWRMACDDVALLKEICRKSNVKIREVK